MEQVLRRFGPLLDAIAQGARGVQAARAAMEEMLPQFEQGGWRIEAAVRRIWAGERDRASLCEGIDPNSAMLVRGVLERVEKG
jgi:hypothetical protein